jgi:hypothetical protein
VTFQVGAGTTLDIGTSHIAQNNTGSFILDSGATLVSTHLAPGNEGNIETLADFGGGNSFVNVLATSGTGSVSVTATKGAHPNAFAPSKSLQRYWTVTADPGITQASMTFSYFDVPVATSTEVMGTESAYKALRYSGNANGWYTLANSTVDDLFDFVSAPGVTTVSGVWTVGEATPDPSTTVGGGSSEIPSVFFVHQNFPNPFNPSSTVVFGLPSDMHVTATVHDVLGRTIAVLIDAPQRAGSHTLTIDGGGWSSGLYLLRVTTPQEQKIVRLTLLK